MAFVTKFGFMDGWMDRIGLDWIGLNYSVLCTCQQEIAPSSGDNPAVGQLRGGHKLGSALRAQPTHHCSRRAAALIP